MKLPATRPAASDARLRQLVLDLAASPRGWLHLVRYDPGQRWYQRVLREEDREVWLLSESAAPAVSVHAYSPPLTTMDRFEVSGGRLVRAAAEMAGQW